MKTTLGKFAILFVALAMWRAHASSFTFYNVMSCQPGGEKECARDCVDYVRRTGNREILFSMTLHPEGKPAIRKVDETIASYRRMRRELEGTDVRLGILIQAIVGHWPRVDKDIEPWTRTIDIDGKVVRFCALDPEFAAYIREVGRKCAAERPFMILTDDDVRAFSPRPECFCELHRREFCRRMGREFTPEEFRRVVAESHVGDKTQNVFIDLQRELVNRIAALVREGIDQVDPAIPAGTCTAGQWHRYADEPSRAIAAKGQRPLLRLNSANYNETTIFNLPWNVMRTMTQSAILGPKADLLDESDTYPHNYWSKTAVSYHAHVAIAIMAGMKGAKIWFVNAHRGRYEINRGYTDIMARNRGFYPAFASAVEGAEFIGLAYPCTRGLPDRKFPNHTANQFWGDGIVVADAVHYGIPYRPSWSFGDRDTVFALSDPDEIKRLAPGDLEKLFAGRLYVDGAAAAHLAKLGYADLMGCDAEGTATGFTFERSRMSPDDLVLAPVDNPAALRARPGSHVLSELCYRPFAGAADVSVVAPGAVLCTNRLGGVVLTTAFRYDTKNHHRFSEARKQWLVDCLDVLNGGMTPFVSGDAQPVLTLAKRRADGEHVVLVLNMSFEALDGVRLRLPAGTSQVRRIMPDGTFSSLAFDRDAQGYAKLDATLPCYGVAVFVIR